MRSTEMISPNEDEKTWLNLLNEWTKNGYKVNVLFLLSKDYLLLDKVDL